ncbi:hypothetical protein [Flavobacterium sp.]|jgi:hypothetical protein|nr:hypothetical protein [Flavobacterium sp.]
MKIVITLKQLKGVLRTQPIKPVVFKVANFNDKEMLELSKMFQEKERC